MAKPPKDRTDTGERRGKAQDVGSLLPSVGGMAFRKFGFAQSHLIGRWREVVGPVYARWSVPDSLRFAKGAKTGGTLTIRVEGPFATQLQHVTPQIVERVNRIFGYAAVERVRLVQGEVPRPADRPRAAAPAASATPGPNLSGVQDDGLRASLEALARQMASTQGPPKIK